ncbi:hypothetical protein ACLOJK_005777 [Asimina triloba]
MRHVSSAPDAAGQSPDEKEKVEAEKERVDGEVVDVDVCVEVLPKSSLKRPLSRSGSNNVEKGRVQWVDFVGKDLVEIREFEPRLLAFYCFVDSSPSSGPGNSFLYSTQSTMTKYVTSFNDPLEVHPAVEQDVAAPKKSNPYLSLGQYLPKVPLLTPHPMSAHELNHQLNLNLLTEASSAIETLFAEALAVGYHWVRVSGRSVDYRMHYLELCWVLNSQKLATINALLTLLGRLTGKDASALTELPSFTNFSNADYCIYMFHAVNRETQKMMVMVIEVVFVLFSDFLCKFFMEKDWLASANTILIYERLEHCCECAAAFYSDMISHLSAFVSCWGHQPVALLLLLPPGLNPKGARPWFFGCAKNLPGTTYSPPFDFGSSANQVLDER